jgi:hypothetical protein
MGIRSTISMYADNTTGFVSSHRDLCLFMLELHIYEHASGSLINYAKSSIIFLGPKFHSGQLQIIENNETDRILSFMIGTEASDDLVHKEVVNKFVNRCNFWSSSSLSIHGRTAMTHIFAETTMYTHQLPGK